MYRDILEYFTEKTDEGYKFKKGVMETIYEKQDNPFEWLDETTAKTLDERFILEHSGSKKLSPLFERLIFFSRVYETPFAVMDKLADDVINAYADKWNKLYSAIISSSYNPLENYNMEQVETPDITRERDTSQNTKVTTSSSGDSSSGVHGFNSAVAVPTEEGETSSEVTVEGDKKDNTTHEEETETGTRELTRHGNIGVTTSQQMLESEVTLREKVNFYNIVLNDIAKLLCLNVY